MPRNFGSMLALAATVAVFATSSGHSQGAPELLAPGTISIGGVTTYRPTFTPDGTTVYFTVEARGGYAVAVSHKRGGTWSAPELAPFSGEHSDAEAILSPDGSRLVFASQRPLREGEAPRSDYDLWEVERFTDGRLGEPRHLGPAINTDLNELYPSLSRNGALYFSRSAGGEGSDLFRAAPARPGYVPAERLPAPINGEARESGVFIAPDETYILFESTRAGGLGGADIYMSRRDGPGWSPPRNLGSPVNSPALETSPTVSPDGRTLYVASGRRFPGAGLGRGLTFGALVAGVTALGNGKAHIYAMPFPRVAPSVGDRPPGPHSSPAGSAASCQRGDEARSRLKAALRDIAARAHGRMGAAVMNVRCEWIAAVNGDQGYPQQSVVKLWVALAALEASDAGMLRLSEPALVRPADLSLFHQPIAAEVKPEGYRTTLAELVRRTAVDSDNAANDWLVRRLGGPAAVQAVLRRKGLEGIRIDREERVMQAELNGLVWSPRYTDPAVFEAARARLPAPLRTAALDQYLGDPRDTATPVASARGLARLARGELLGGASTELLLGYMRSVGRAQDRLRAGVPGSWVVAHRPGTGGVWQGRGAAMNDIGLLTSPEGDTFAVAVYLSDSTLPAAERAALIADVARAVVRHQPARAAAIP